MLLVDCMLQLDKIITSDLRLNLLRYFLVEKPTAKASIRQLSRELNYAPSHVKQELDVLETAGILESQKIANHKVYVLVYQGPLIKVFQSEPHLLLDKLKDVAGMTLAYVYSVVKNDFKIIIIGKPDIYFLNRVVRNIQEDNIDIDFKVLHEDEVYKKNLPIPLFFVIGDLEQLNNLKSQTVRHDKLKDYRKRKWER